MRKCLQLMVGLGGAVLFATAATGITTDAPVNRFRAIPERNVFRLKAPEPPARVEQQAPALPKLILTGITTILGNKRALMKEEAQAQAGKAAEPISLILTEGQREGNVEVLQIDENAGSVTVNQSGTIRTLTFDKDGAKLPNTPAPTNATQMANGAIPAPPATPATQQYVPPQNLPGLPSMPLRGMRVPNRANQASTAPRADGGVLSPTGRPTTTPGQPPMTAEEQAVFMELQRQANANNPDFPPLPPTAITQGELTTPNSPAASAGAMAHPTTPAPNTSSTPTVLMPQ